VEEPVFECSSANQTAGTAFVVRVMLKHGAPFQAQKQIGNGDVIFQHLLLRMKRELYGPPDGQASYVILNRGHLLLKSSDMDGAPHAPAS
jgi:hypothetical protein